MSSLVHTHRNAFRGSPAGLPAWQAAVAIVRTILGWPLRVHANRKLLNQMAGMSAHELADIGLTSADLQDTGALPLDSEVGQFLARRAHAHRWAARSWRA